MGISPVISEFAWSGTENKKVTFSRCATGQTHMLADIFVTVSTSDHQNIFLGESNQGNSKNWVDTRGQRPKSQFGAKTSTNKGVTVTYHGESDGFTANYGTWYSSVIVKGTCVNGNFEVYFGNYGNSGSKGWVWGRARAYAA